MFAATKFILQEERDMKYAKNILFVLMVLAVAACSPKIYGRVQLVDANLQPIPPAQESPQGTVVVLIMFTTVPCGLSWAGGMGCRFASTSWTLP